MEALGIIDAIGWSTAVSALDAACKAADVTLIGVEKVIGIDSKVGVSVHFVGDVGAVTAAVDAGVEYGSRVGTIVARHIIPRPHEEIEKLIDQFRKNLRDQKKEADKAPSNNKQNKQNNESEGSKRKATNSATKTEENTNTDKSASV